MADEVTLEVNGATAKEAVSPGLCCTRLSTTSACWAPVWLRSGNARLLRARPRCGDALVHHADVERGRKSVTTFEGLPAYYAARIKVPLCRRCIRYKKP